MICPRCRATQRVFRYPSKEPPYWYVVAHEVDGELCAGSGYPAVEGP